MWYSSTQIYLFQKIGTLGPVPLFLPWPENVWACLTSADNLDLTTYIEDSSLCLQTPIFMWTKVLDPVTNSWALLPTFHMNMLWLRLKVVYCCFQHLQYSWDDFLIVTHCDHLQNYMFTGNLCTMPQHMQALYWTHSRSVCGLSPWLCPSRYGEPLCPMLWGWNKWHRLLHLWPNFR